MVLLGDIEPRERGEYWRDITIPVPPKFAARTRNGLRDLNRLMESRKGFRGKSRSWAVYILCWLRRTGTQLGEEEIFSEAMGLGAKCVPPLSDRAVMSAFTNSRKWGKLANAKIATRLQITKQERAMKLFPTPPRKAYKPGGLSDAQVRHARIWQIVERRGTVPTVSELLEELDCSYGIEVSDKTIRRDYTSLGIKNPHTPGAVSQPAPQKP